MKKMSYDYNRSMQDDVCNYFHSHYSSLKDLAESYGIHRNLTATEVVDLLLGEIIQQLFITDHFSDEDEAAEALINNDYFVDQIKTWPTDTALDIDAAIRTEFLQETISDCLDSFLSVDDFSKDSL